MLFKELETDRLFLKNISSDDRDFIYTDNENSIKLAENFGFVFNGQMKDYNFRRQKYSHKIFIKQCGKPSFTTGTLCYFFHPAFTRLGTPFLAQRSGHVNVNRNLPPKAFSPLDKKSQNVKK